MNLFEVFIYSLKGTMETPKPYGWFHLFWIFAVVILITILYKFRKKYNENQLKSVLAIYGIIAFLLELFKQLIWSFDYNFVTNTAILDYQWYAFPFQLCTTPIFVSLICLFLKKNNLRKSLLSYMAYVTILGSFMTILIPDSCFVSDTLVNIHTMWLHCGSFVVSVYLIMTGAVKVNKESFKNGFKVFLVFAFIAEVLNIFIYNSGILNGETFNMFYISPYFISTLPVFDVIQQSVSFVLYLLIYIIAIFMGALIVYGISYLFRGKSNKKDTKKSKKVLQKKYINV